jgi:hypothetical protein
MNSNDIKVVQTEIKYSVPLSGNIYGFFPNIDYFQGNQGKLDIVWSVKISEFYYIGNEYIIIRFIWDGVNFNSNMKRINECNFQGRIFRNGDDIGTAYFTLYENIKGYLLRGTWEEDGVQYDSIVDVRKNAI